MHGPTLLTPRLLLRPPIEEDFAAFANFGADPEVTTFLGGPQPRAAAWRSFAMLAGSWWLRGYAMFSLIERSTGRWIGRAGPWFPEGWPGTEVGWGLLRDAQGQGYAQEAATAAIDFAFDTLGWTEVVHVIAPENLRSIRLAERLGSTPRGPTQLPAPNEATVCHLWGQTREAWHARSRVAVPSGDRDS